jgi:hypothetical protein
MINYLEITPKKIISPSYAEIKIRENVMKL